VHVTFVSHTGRYFLRLETQNDDSIHSIPLLTFILVCWTAILFITGMIIGDADVVWTKENDAPLVVVINPCS
jgi:hypothetical protein